MNTIDFKSKEYVMVFFNRISEDKKAVNKCIMEGGDWKDIAGKRGAKFANPI